MPATGPDWVFKIVATDPWSEPGDDPWSPPKDDAGTGQGDDPKTGRPDDRGWPGTALDVRDGFVHLSTAEQVPGTLARHYSGRTGLSLLWVRVGDLPTEHLRWEPSRGGQLFPHLYAPLQRGWIARTDPLEIGPSGEHLLPEDLDASG